MAAKSVYVHIPFCAKMCHYCDFATYAVKGQPVDAYLDALELEMKLTLSEAPAGDVSTIFIGGGTPTILTPGQIERLLAALERHFPRRAPDFEFTVEANPGTVDQEKLAVLRAGGVNRLSFGVQSFDNRLLQVIGRDHDTDAILQSIDDARAAGFNNISLDLMFGLPEQSLEDLRDTLSRAFALDVEHFSAYALIIEERTPFHVWQQQGKLTLPTDDEEFEMYGLVRNSMADHGFAQYEVSNFSRPGFESRHNRTYWLNDPYYGFGVGAHGYVAGKRHANVRGVKPYIQMLNEGRLPRAEQYAVGHSEDMENTMILGLRLREGVSFRRFRERHGVDLLDVYGEQVEALKEKNWLETDERAVRLTEKGLLWGNDVFAQFLSVL